MLNFGGVLHKLHKLLIESQKLSLQVNAFDETASCQEAIFLSDLAPQRREDVGLGPTFQTKGSR